MSKNVAIFIDSLSGGGAEKVVLTLIDAIQHIGHSVTLFVLHKRIEYTLPKKLYVCFLHQDPDQKTKGWFNRQAQALKLNKQVVQVEKERGKFDLFLVNLEESYHIVSACDFAPCFYVVHNSIEETLIRTKKLGLLKYLYVKKQFSYLNNQHVISVSQGIERELNRAIYIHPASVRTIYNPFEIEKIKQLANLANPAIPNEKYIIHIGRFAKQKRHDILLTAFKDVSMEYKLVCLCGNTKKLSQLAKKLGVLSRLITPGFEQNPYSWLKHAQLLVLSSDYEGFGNVLVEAMICGTPVVATDCPHGPNEILTGELQNYLVPRGDPNKLAHKINQALQENIDISDPDILKKVDAINIAQQYLTLIDAG